MLRVLAASVAAACAAGQLLSARAAAALYDTQEPGARVARAAGSTLIYTDRATFIAALAAGYDVNDFSDVRTGAAGGLTYAHDGIETLVYTQFGARGALYGGDGFVSTDRATDKLTVTLGGVPVTAIGADFRAVEFSSRPVDGAIVLTLDDGTQETIEADSSGHFRGFIATAPIGRLTIDAPDLAQPAPGASPDRWPALDDLILGSGR